MNNQNVLEVVTVAPREAQQFMRQYDLTCRTRWGYSIDVPEDVRHMVKSKMAKMGTEENGLEIITIHNWSFCPAVVTFFEFEE